MKAQADFRSIRALIVIAALAAAACSAWRGLPPRDLWRDGLTRWRGVGRAQGDAATALAAAGPDSPVYRRAALNAEQSAAQFHAFLAANTPDPLTLAALGTSALAAAAGLAFLLRRCRRRGRASAVA